jgi:hypothetical protein
MEDGFRSGDDNSGSVQEQQEWRRWHRRRDWAKQAQIQGGWARVSFFFYFLIH